MDDMKAKNLFGKVEEAGPGERPPGPGGPPRRRMPGFEDEPEGMLGGLSGPDPVRRMVGREEPKGQFTAKELSQLKDVMIIILAYSMNSKMDMDIAQALIAGKDLEPGLLQHIVDEARGMPIPDSHNALLQKIFTKLQSPPQ